MKFVLVKHDEGSGYYLFTVPKERDLKFGDRVLLKTRKGIKTGVCVCNSFSISDEENVEKLCQMNGTQRERLTSVIGTVFYQLWEEDYHEPDL